MPSGRTHDAITFLAAIPAAAVAWWATGNWSVASVAGVAFIFGGLMFGPDLDTVSRQYSRWWIFRWLWFPYRSFFRHRSRFSHGLILGSLLRVIYLFGAITLIAFAAAYIYSYFEGGRIPAVADVARLWSGPGEYTRRHFGEYFLIVVFAGVWAGAASHTVTDMFASFIKTGRAGKFF
jgi:uncharacterized metal-binding protein